MSNRVTTALILTLSFCIGVTGLYAQDDSWNVRSGITEREGHTSVVFNGRMWVLGGVSSTIYLNDVWSSTNGTDWTLESKAAPWAPRKGHASVVFNNRIWVIGGYIGQVSALNDVWSSTDGVNWTLETAAAAWSARAEHTVSVFGGELWLVAGSGGNGTATFGGLASDVWTSTDGVNWTQQTAPAWVARSGHSAVVQNGELFILGGSGGQPYYSYLADVWAHDGNVWSLKTATAWPGYFGPRTGASAFTYNGEMYIVAGNAGGGYFASQNATGEVWSSTDGVSWTSVTTGFGWAAREGHTALAFNNEMWVIAGLANGWNGGLFGLGKSGQPVSDVWSSTNGTIWTEATPDGGFNAWSSRSGHTTENFNNKLWVIGGHSAITSGGFTPRNDVWSSTDGVSWTEETPAAGWIKRDGHGSAVLNNKLWVIGGQGYDTTTYTYSVLNDVWSSNDGQTWVQTAATSGWSARRDHATIAFGGKLWVIGGSDGITTFGDVWSSSDGINWTLETNTPGWAARAQHTVEAFNNRLWMFGGWDGTDYFHDVWSSADGANWTQESTSSAWPKRYGHDTAIADGRIWLIGGKAHLPALTATTMVTMVTYPPPTGPSEFTTTAPGVPSGEKTMFISASNLSGDITVTPPAEFEIALAGGSFQTGPLVLAQAAGVIASTPIRVRYNPSSVPTAGSHTGDVQVATAGLERLVAVSGALRASATPSIAISGGLLPFAAAMGTPSPEQTYSVEAENLSADLILTAPVNYEIALVGGAFQTTLNLTPTGGSVPTTTIRVRYSPTSAQFAAGVVHSSVGADDQTAYVAKNTLPYSWKIEMSDVWSSADGINWVAEPFAPMRPRIDHTLAALNGSIWVLGGGRVLYDVLTATYNTVPFTSEVWEKELPKVELATTSINATEGSLQATLGVQLNGTYAFDVSIDYATSNGTATAPEDYAAANGTVTIPAGQTSANIIVTVVDDQLDEPDEDLQVTLSNPQNATAGTQLNATVQILDDDGAPTVRFAAPTYSVSESGGQVSIDIELSNASGYDVQVDYATADVTASAGLDYTYDAGTVLIPVGQLSVSVFIPVLDDNIFEDNEEFVIQLTNPANGTLGATALTNVTITDDETAPSIGFVLAQLDVNEPDGSVMVEVNLNNPSAQQVTVDFGFLGGTATPGVDFSDTPGTLVFNPGEVSKFLSLGILDDTAREDDETFQVTLINPVGGSNGTNAALDVTILADANDVSSVGGGNGSGDGSGGCVSNSGSNALWLMLAALGLAVVAVRRRRLS